MAKSGALAQDKASGGRLGLPTNFALPGNRQELGKLVDFTAKYELETGGKAGRIKVSAKLSAGKHLYSTTQPPGGPTATRIKLEESVAKAAGPFQSDRAPEINSSDAWPGLPIEEHHGEVTWTAPIVPTDELATTKADLSLKIDALVCSDGEGGNCVPVTETVTAKFTGFYGGEKKTTSYRAEHSHATVTAKLEPGEVNPGSKAKILLRIAPDEGYHVYTYQPQDEEINNRTLIWVSSKSGLRFGTPSTQAKTETVELSADEKIVHHVGTVDWEIPIEVPGTFVEGAYPIEILVGYQICNDRSCEPPTGALVSGSLQVAKTASSTVPVELSLSKADYKNIADAPARLTWIDADPTQVGGKPNSKSLGAAAPAPVTTLTLWHLLAAIAGGFLLNFMPCVLPVIGLKIMSFVDQSGNDRKRVIALNLAFVLGLMSVLWVLAAVTITAKVFGSSFAWGQQFTLLEFKVPMAAFLFAMALSFLGVWEIPIPGFATTSKSGKLMEREGLSGAFFKGVLSTVLATPCSGPFLGALFGITLTLSAVGVMLIYTFVGLGMAAPYLALCISPRLVRLLPKPGAWMETLKQALAFPLLFTVVFFVASISDEYRIATLTLLIVVWLACWLVGRVPAYAERYRIRNAWVAAMAIIAIGGTASFAALGPLKHHLPWQPYNPAALTVLRSEGRTVMLDFTANWCFNCQLNTRWAIDRPKVAKLVEEYGIVPMLADWTDRGPEIQAKLAELQSNSIPVLAIYPSDPDAAPIILRDVITESQLIESLKRAGPSRLKGRLATTSNPRVSSNE